MDLHLGDLSNEELHDRLRRAQSRGHENIAWEVFREISDRYTAQDAATGLRCYDVKQMTEADVDMIRNDDAQWNAGRWLGTWSDSKTQVKAKLIEYLGYGDGPSYSIAWSGPHGRGPGNSDDAGHGDKPTYRYERLWEASDWRAAFEEAQREAIDTVKTQQMLRATWERQKEEERQERAQTQDADRGMEL